MRMLRAVIYIIILTITVAMPATKTFTSPSPSSKQAIVRYVRRLKSTTAPSLATLRIKITRKLKFYLAVRRRHQRIKGEAIIIICSTKTIGGPRRMSFSQLKAVVSQGIRKWIIINHFLLFISNQSRVRRQ